MNLESFTSSGRGPGQVSVAKISFELLGFAMQAHEELDPTVRIRDLKKDRVNFVLENVDLACA